MPKINIQEIDNTVANLSANNSGNIVYVPGTAITGPYDAPKLVTSLAEFKSLFGETGVSTSPTWYYVAGLLTNGLPVLFRRIVGANMESDTPTIQIRFATAEIKKDVTTGEGDDAVTTATTFMTVTEKYGGTYGNNVYVSIEKLTSAVYFKVFYGTNLIENVRLCGVASTDEPTDIKNNIIQALQNTKFETVTVTVDNIEVFDYTLVSRVKLSGGADLTEAQVQAEIPKSYGFVKDKYIYDFKFVSSGGYTDTDSSNLTIANAMIDLAESRQDCTAILDIPQNLDKALVPQFFTMVDTSYAAAFAPWCYMKLFDNTYDWMPPSYVFFRVLGKSIKDGNSIWDVPAGVIRATIKECVKPEYEIGGDTLNAWQEANPQCINPIMKVRSYGYVIYGNRTLFNMEDTSDVYRSALQELGVRIVTNDIKRAIFNAALYLTFSNNNIHTWNEFKAKLEPTLQEMESVRAIADYQVIMDETTVTDEYISANKIFGIVRVAVSRSAEDFDIAFELESSNVTFRDEESEIDV